MLFQDDSRDKSEGVSDLIIRESERPVLESKHDFILEMFCLAIFGGELNITLRSYYGLKYYNYSQDFS